MTPEARIAAAITILDAVLDGQAAEQALTRWARGSRFAGSRDRAAVRDHVYDALRCRRSFAALGGAETGRGLMIGLLRAGGVAPESLFTGVGYGPEPLTAEEGAPPPDLTTLPRGVRLDCPDWLMPDFDTALGDNADEVLTRMRQRAPVCLRANARQGREAAARALAAEGIETILADGASFALEVVANAQKIKTSTAYSEGLVELQDLSPQCAVEALPLQDGMRVLDYCAGGGGKTLAMAARAELSLTAHDAIPARMKDLPTRAARAGIAVTQADTGALAKMAPFDLVLTDVPCSGTGTWRRGPEAKWTLTPDRLADLLTLQADILDRAAAHVAPGGWLIYMTCSLLSPENRGRIDRFLARNHGFALRHERLFTPLEGGDGFYAAHLSRV